MMRLRDEIRIAAIVIGAMLCLVVLRMLTGAQVADIGGYRICK